jgi:hypothetical protein
MHMGSMVQPKCRRKLNKHTIQGEYQKGNYRFDWRWGRGKEKQTIEAKINLGGALSMCSSLINSSKNATIDLEFRVLRTCSSSFHSKKQKSNQACFLPSYTRRRNRIAQWGMIDMQISCSLKLSWQRVWPWREFFHDKGFGYDASCELEVIIKLTWMRDKSAWSSRATPWEVAAVTAHAR